MQRYPAMLRVLHWLIVALVVVQFAIAWTMPEQSRKSHKLYIINVIGLTDYRFSPKS